MSEDLMRSMIVGAVLLLLFLFIFRIKRQTKRMIKNEIFSNFPSIKNKIEDFGNRLDFLKTKIDELERRITELHKHTGGKCG